MLKAKKETIAAAPTKATAATTEMTASEVLAIYANNTTLACLSANASEALDKIGVGKEHAFRLSNRDNNNAASRAIRLAVAELREAGIPVVNVGDGEGYYIPRPDRLEEVDELKHMAAQMSSRISKLHKAKNGLGKAIFRAELQQSMNLIRGC